MKKDKDGNMDEAAPWHSQVIDAIATRLRANINVGLSENEARARLQKYGPNHIIKERTSSPLTLFFQQFRSIVIWVLIGASIVSIALGEKVDGIAIVAIVILNAIIGFSLEYRADKALMALQKLSVPKAKVLREAALHVIPASDLVPGDIILFESGDFVPADSRLIDAFSLKTHEAPLTGESEPVEKNIEICLPETQLADQKNKVFMGTSIVNGTGRAIVVATGMNTEIGHIAQLLQTAETAETPLQKRLNRVAFRLLLACFAIVIIIFTLGLLRGIPWFELFMSAVSLAVAAIPEGLPAVVMVALALGVQRMVRRHALVRHLASVETMGSLQVICTDKTGTLTVGEMTARKLVTAEHIYNIQGEGYNLEGSFFINGQAYQNPKDSLLLSVLNAATACNNAEFRQDNKQLYTTIGDPTEIALLVAAAKAGIWRNELEKNAPRVMEIPFDSDRKRMTVIRKQHNEIFAFVKGASEVILPRCTQLQTSQGIKEMTQAEYSQMMQSCALMASEALRVLAIAQRPFNSESSFPTGKMSAPDAVEQNLILLGLIGLQDPPRAEAKEAVYRCKQAGIKPVMITGDHPETARAIANELALFEPGDEIITGTELSVMSNEALEKRVNKISVYARVTAEHKIKIVRAWKKLGCIVAMTGDGVNDAPALKEASVGIAMGKTGTEVTKEAADIVILDDNFASIVAAVEEGRGIYDNIAKTLAYLLAGNAGELMVMFVALFIGWPLPLLPIQLLWINLITDGLPALALATDAPEADILQKPPHKQSAQFMDRLFFQRIFFIGFLTASVSLATFAYEFYVRNDLSSARDAAFTVLVIAELLRSFGARSQTKTIFEIGFLTNLRLLLIVVISFSLQILIHHVSWLRQVFNIEMISWFDCLVWIVVGAIPLMIIEVMKVLHKAKE